MPTIVPISVSAYVADPMHIFAGPNDVWMVDYTSGLNQITTPGLVQSQINGISDQQAACYGPDGQFTATQYEQTTHQAPFSSQQLLPVPPVCGESVLDPTATCGLVMLTMGTSTRSPLLVS